MAMLGQFLCVLWNFEIFHDRLFDQVWGTTLPLFKDFKYQPEIWWDDAQHHKADRYVKWPSSANFCVFQEDEIEEITLRPEIWWHEGAAVLWTSCINYIHRLPFWLCLLYLHSEPRVRMGPALSALATPRVTSDNPRCRRWRPGRYRDNSRFSGFVHLL